MWGRPTAPPAYRNKHLCLELPVILHHSSRKFLERRCHSSLGQGQMRAFGWISLKALTNQISVFLVQLTALSTPGDAQKVKSASPRHSLSRRWAQPRSPGPLGFQCVERCTAQHKSRFASVRLRSCCCARTTSATEHPPARRDPLRSDGSPSHTALHALLLLTDEHYSSGAAGSAAPSLRRTSGRLERVFVRFWCCRPPILSLLGALQLPPVVNQQPSLPRN